MGRGRELFKKREGRNLNDAGAYRKEKKFQRTHKLFFAIVHEYQPPGVYALYYNTTHEKFLSGFTNCKWAGEDI